MDDQKTLKEKIKDEIAKIKEMEPKKRLTYLKDYYLVKTLIVLGLLIMLFSMLNEMVFSRKNSLYVGGLLGCSISEEGKTKLTDDFRDYLNGNPKKDVVYLYDDLVMSFSETEGESYMNVEVDAAIFTMMAAGEFNYLICSDSFVEKYKDAGVFVDSSAYADMYGIAEEDRYVYQNEVIGMKLSDEICGKYGLSSEENMYFCVMASRNENDNEKAFLNYFFN